MFKWIESGWTIVKNSTQAIYDAIVLPTFNLIGQGWHLTRSIGYKSYNYLWTSKLHMYYLEIHNKATFKLIKSLMEKNKLTTDSTSSTESHKAPHPMFPYMLGPLTEQAKLNPNGIARVDLNLNFSLKSIGLPLDWHPRVLSLVSVTETNAIRRFMDLPGREAFTVPSMVAGIRNFSALPWTELAKKEKQLLKSALAANKTRIWPITLQLTQRLVQDWREDMSLSKNITLYVLGICAKAALGIEHIPAQLFDETAEMEDLWQHQESFTAQRFIKNVHHLKTISDQMHKERLEASVLTPEHMLYAEQKLTIPPLKSDFVKDFFEFHRDHTQWMAKAQDLNIAAWLTIFGNLPKLILGLVLLVLNDPKWLAQLATEKQRLRRKMTALDINEYEEEGFRYICTHSELLQRFILETERKFFIAPMLPRINSNLFFNSLFGYGHSMDLNDNPSDALPPRSFAIVPLRALATEPAQWKNSDCFDPWREEYQFKIIEHPTCPIVDGTVKSIGKMPMAFGDVGSKRACPGRHISQDLALACLWALSDLYEIQLTAKEKAHLNLPDAASTHHMKLELETEIPIHGRLISFKHHKERQTSAIQTDTEIDHPLKDLLDAQRKKDRHPLHSNPY